MMLRASFWLARAPFPTSQAQKETTASMRLLSNIEKKKAPLLSLFISINNIALHTATIPCGVTHAKVLFAIIGRNWKTQHGKIHILQRRNLGSGRNSKLPLHHD
jgi:siderophore synthetase component